MNVEKLKAMSYQELVEITGDDAELNEMREMVNDLSVEEVKEIFLGEKELEVE